MVVVMRVADASSILATGGAGSGSSLVEVSCSLFYDCRS